MYTKTRYTSSVLGWLLWQFSPAVLGCCHVHLHRRGRTVVGRETVHRLGIGWSRGGGSKSSPKI